jgi:HTH-type transcriptional regulator, transcriptional repressor of NAD biosynthesis genes
MSQHALPATPASGLRFARGLVVGKFSPLHKGHEALVEHAAARCGALLVLGYSQPELPGCPRPLRQRWMDELLQARHPQVRAVALDEPLVRQRCAERAVPWREMPPNGAADEVHQAYLAWLLAGPLDWVPDALFCGEAWGPRCAQTLSRALGSPVQAVVLDPMRERWPISATLIRARPAAAQGFLSPAVWADHLPRVVLLGGESTGKTTLAAALAQAVHSEWVPEYGRERWEAQQGRLSEADLLCIAQEQLRREDEAAHRVAQAGGGVLVCDTSALTTWCYADLLYGRAAAALQALAQRPYALTVLCGDELRFDQDGTRRDAAFQARQQAWLAQALARHGVSPLSVQGSVAQRVQQVLSALHALGWTPGPEPRQAP